MRSRRAQFRGFLAAALAVPLPRHHRRRDSRSDCAKSCYTKSCYTKSCYTKSRYTKSCCTKSCPRGLLRPVADRDRDGVGATASRGWFLGADTESLTAAPLTAGEPLGEQVKFAVP